MHSRKPAPGSVNPGGEYFVLEDAEKKRRIALDTKRAMAAEERRAMQELHHMHCPKCGMKMQEVRLGEVHADTCFSCGGVFLDKKDIIVIAHPQQKGIMGAILNWFKDETQTPVK